MSSHEVSPAALRPAEQQRVGFGMFLIMFFLSGVAALIYQIVWAKELALVFGVTLYATSAVVTTFMAGLAFGSLYFGRVVDRWNRPLVLFALLEIGIGAFALVFPAIAVLLRRSYVLFCGPFGDNHYVMSLVRFGMSFLVLIVPTSLMGGTLPVIAKACVVQDRELGRSVAGLYAANNLGAFLGCMLAGYVLLELLGPAGALGLAALLNLAVVAMALYASARTQPHPAWLAAPAQDPAGDTAGPSRLSGPVRVALWVFGLEGVTSLVYQMAWMRVLIFFVKMDIYGVTAIVGTFLAGLSLGAFVSRRWVDRLRNPYRTLGLIEFGIGTAALATIPALPFLLGVHQALLNLESSGLPLSIAFSAANFGVTFAVILVPTAFMGATLPVVSRIYVAELRGIGRKMGVLGCLDTVGSIVGAFAGGFVLIPLLGVQRTIIATALLNLLLAGWVVHADPVSRVRPLRRVAFLGSAGGMLLSASLLFLKPTPLIEYSHVLMGQPILRLVQYEEDEVASASVVEQRGLGRFLYVNDHAVAGDFPQDLPSHELEMHLPLLLHPHPKRVLVIGLGAGLSVRTALVHDTDVDVVELSRSVVRVNPCFREAVEDYRRQHGGRDVLEDPRVRIRIEDGRNFVLGSPEKYDVIHVGGFHPVLTSGSAGFYAVEFYQDCQRLLTPDGVFSQWLPIHQIPQEDFKTILRSFRAGFPHTSIWHKHSSDYCTLMGSLKPLRIDFQDFERRTRQPAVLAHLARSNVYEVWDLLDAFCLGEDAIDRAVGAGPLQTDRHPYIEYHKFRGMLSDNVENLKLLANAREPVLPYLTDVPPDRLEEVKAQLARWFAATQELLRAQYIVADQRRMAPATYGETFQRAAAAYARAMELNPADVNARFLWKLSLARYNFYLARYHFGRNRPLALHYLHRAAEASPDSYWGAEARFVIESQARGEMVRPR